MPAHKIVPPIAGLEHIPSCMQLFAWTPFYQEKWSSMTPINGEKKTNMKMEKYGVYLE